MELNKDQSKKADYLLKVLCNSSSAMGSETVYKLFKTKNEAIYICSVLSELGLITVIAPTENDPINMVSFNENTCYFLESGGFLKKYNQNENKQTIQPIAKPNKKYAIISFIEKFWWKFLIPLAVIIIGWMIEKGIINISIFVEQVLKD